MKSTREGRRFLLATALIAVAAVNTGNNLIYLVLALMLSFLLLAFLIPKLNLARLDLSISVEGQVFAGEAAYARVRVLNKKKRLPAYSVHVTSPDSQQDIVFHQLEAGGSSERLMKMLFGRRGHYRQLSATIESSFPFILFYQRKRFDVAADIMVHPAYYDLEAAESLTQASGAAGKIRMSAAGDDILHIREFRYGDDLKRIHWKASAKMSSLMIREYAEHENARTTILLDNSSPGAPGDFEKAVSITSELARRSISDGNLVRVLTCSTVVPYGAGHEHLLRVLDMLALVQEEDSPCPAPLPDEDAVSFTVLKSTAAGPGTRAGQGSGAGSGLGGAVIYADTV